MLFFFARTFFIFILVYTNIPDSGASEYSTTDISNSGVGKYYVGIKINKFKSSFFFYSWLWRQWINK
jgi:hypothetical protein